MPLLDSEVMRIKAELGYNQLEVGAEPYIGVRAVFDQVVKTYLSEGSATTSATDVVAASSATPVVLTLASVTGFAAHAPVVVDVGERLEASVVQSVVGNTITVALMKAHSGSYPVQVEEGLARVRRILRELDLVYGNIAATRSTAGIKRVDEIEFFEGGASQQFRDLTGLRDYWRDELAATLGVQNLWTHAGSGAAMRLELY